ncbi:hypothetical protein EBR78_11680 [bacterium]|nr:hypothetical protein [bacterium]
MARTIKPGALIQIKHLPIELTYHQKTTLGLGEEDRLSVHLSLRVRFAFAPSGELLFETNRDTGLIIDAFEIEDLSDQRTQKKEGEGIALFVNDERVAHERVYKMLCCNREVVLSRIIASLATQEVRSGNLDEQFVHQKDLSDSGVLRNRTKLKLIKSNQLYREVASELNHNWVAKKPPANGIQVPPFFAHYGGESFGPFTNISECSYELSLKTGLAINAGSVRHCLAQRRNLEKGISFTFQDPSSDEALEWVESARAAA